MLNVVALVDQQLPLMEMFFFAREQVPLHLRHGQKVHCKEWNLKEIPDCAIKKLAFQFDYKMAKLSGEYQIPPSLILNNVQALKLCHC